MSSKNTAIIIGSGVGGLALANILAKAGLEVTVYEKNSTPGGRMGVLRKQGFTFDTGPSWYLMKDVFINYFKMFNKHPEDFYNLKKLDPAYKVFFETINPVVIKSDINKNYALFESLEAGSSMKLKRYLERGQKNYQSALKSFLYNPFKKSSTLLNLQNIKSSTSFLAVFTRSLHSYVSKHFKKLELQQILEYPSVFLGASPFNSPALYQLMSFLDFKEGVYYPKKLGMYAIADALVSLGKELGVKYVYNSPVTKIVTSNGVASGVVVKNKFVPADIVISNADLNFTETKLLDTADRTYPESYWKKRKSGPSALLLYLGIKGSLPELEHHNLFFVNNWRKNFDQIYKNKSWPKDASMYVSKTTATDSSTAPKGHENLFVLVPLPSGVPTEESKVEQYTEDYLKQIEEMSGIKDLRKRIVFKEVRTPEHFHESFNAWENTALGMSHTLRQTAFLRPSVKSKKVKNLFYVGAGSQPGIGVPMCIISAQLVYKYLIKDWSAAAPEEVKEIRL